MTAASRDIFQEIFDKEFKAQFDAKKITYEHRLIRRHGRRRDEMVGRLCLGLQEL